MQVFVLLFLMRKLINDLKGLNVLFAVKDEQITKFFKITLKVWPLSLILKRQITLFGKE